MNGDGGLIALSLDDANWILHWHRYTRDYLDGPTEGGDALAARIEEWISRHSEATP